MIVGPLPVLTLTLLVPIIVYAIIYCCCDFWERKTLDNLLKKSWDEQRAERKYC